jgi:hypothetical protein
MREIEIVEAKTALQAEAIAEREFERVRNIPAGVFTLTPLRVRS